MVAAFTPPNITPNASKRCWRITPACVAEHGLHDLHAPIKRVTGYDTIIPLSRLEYEYIPSVARITDPMLAVETAKAIVEVPAPFSGVIKATHGKPGDTVATGAPLVEFEADATDSLTFDHRCVTGGEAARFLAAVIRDLQKGN
jgi:Biotin-requiring enzyme